MPKATSPKGVEAALKAGEGVSIPRLKLGEDGFIGLRVSNRHILEEANRAFRYPAFIRTVNEMRNNPTVGAAINVYRFMLSRVNWTICPPVGASAIEIERARLIQTMMHDMDHSWASFIDSVIPYMEYGFAINEVVLRRRLKRNGSKYNDGLVGLKKLPTRSQDTIDGWIFSDDGADLIQVQQSLQYLEHGYMFQDRTNEQGRIPIDREKFLLFTSNGTKGNPEGNSIYKNIYLAYKQLTLLQENQLTGIAKDISGVLKIEIPPKYLAPDASDADKAAVAGFQKIIDSYNAGTSRGFLLPRMIDPESKLPLFTYDLLETKGISKYNTETIIRGLQADILTALNVDILRLGADGSGSFSLAESKSSILALAVDAKLKEMANVLDTLIRKLYEANGWEVDNLPSFEYADVEEVDLDSFSSAIQRIFAVGAVEVDREVLNRVRKVLGVSQRPEGEPVSTEELSTTMAGAASSSGQGMAVGTSGSGTAKIGGKSSGKDSSTANKANSP